MRGNTAEWIDVTSAMLRALVVSPIVLILYMCCQEERMLKKIQNIQMEQIWTEDRNLRSTQKRTTILRMIRINKWVR